jgi:thiol-disulfide isomerase/thioredoxin
MDEADEADEVDEADGGTGQPYDEQADARQAIATALQHASEDQKHILLDFGANWCPDCVALERMMEQEPLHSFLEENYHVVPVDVGEWDTNLAIAAEYGNPIEAGIPALVILDPAGQVLTTTSDGSMATASSTTPDEILSFLQQWAPGAASADDLPTPTATSPEASAIIEATGRTQRLETYRMVFQITDQIEGSDVVSYTAAFDGQDVAFSLRDPNMEGSGFDPATGLQVITIDATTYAHGPLPLRDASEPVWYNLGSMQIPAFQPPMHMPMLLNLLLHQGADLAAFEQAGEAVLDGQNCSRYRAGEQPAMSMLNGLGFSTSGEEPSLEEQMAAMNLEAAGVTLHLCDGYIHRVNLHASGAHAETPEAPFDMVLMLQISDAGGEVSITAPEDAVVLQP